MSSNATRRRARPERPPFPAACGLATVVGRRELSRELVRFTFVASGFADMPLDEPGEILTLLWAPPGGEVVLPSGGWKFGPGAEDQHARNYTVRRHDRESATVEIDFVLHGDHGRASRWATDAVPGDMIGWAGPRTHWETDHGRDWAILVADETGLPALAAILETLAPGVRATALVEVAGRDSRIELETDAELDLRWLERDGAAPGTTELLASELRGLPRPRGAGCVWGGGEAAAMTAIRRHARGEWELGADAVKVLGYWKHRTTESWE